MAMRKVVSVVGAGNVGEHVASLIAIKGFADVRLFDIPRKVEDKVFEPVKGKALDMKQMVSAMEIDAKIDGFTVTPEGDGYEPIVDSDIVVITAGFPRRPGMSREDLLDANIKVLNTIITRVKQYAPNSTLIVVTNPVDIMTYVAVKLSGFPTNRVVGMAGILDSARFKTFIAEELRISPKDVHAYVIGGHGDEMVPLISISNVGGIPLKDLIPRDRLNELIHRTRFGGGEIVELMGTSAYYAPAAAVVDMVEALVTNSRRIFPCSVYLDGEAGEYYGVKGFCVGVPVKLGAGGVEEIIKVPMIEEERKMWEKSVESVKKSVETAEVMLGEKSASA